MGETYKQLKAKPAMKDKPCGWCRKPLELGEDAAVCSACGQEHHLACWEEQLGCAAGGCLNAPLKRLKEEAAPADVLPPGKKRCPHCKELVAEREQLCPFCEQSTSPDGLYHGPKENAPGAVASLVWAIVGLFFCGPILGAVAISNAKKAEGYIATSPRYGGEGMAKAGRILGIIDIVLWLLVIALRVLDATS